MLADAVQPLELVTVTLYAPDIAVVAEGLVGLAAVDVNEGPLQEYPEIVPEPAVALANKFKVAPEQIGLLLVGATVGTALMVTEVVAVAVQPRESVTVTLYAPAMAGVAGPLVGF